MRKLIINKGDIFGNLKIISEIEKEGNMRVFNVKCIKCGTIKNTRLNSLIHSITGCNCTHSPLKVKRKPKRTILEKRILSVYNGILLRCYNKKAKFYYTYGGRGIKCEWETFEEFYKDMKDTWKEGLSIDRINNNGNYCKDNCRWVDDFVQANNKNNNILVDGGLTLKQWCNIHGYLTNSQLTKVYRLYKNKLPLEDIKEKMITNNKIVKK